MNQTELFPNPTIKQVIFQIKFPCLFYIENLIGEYQIKIMDRFPESKLLLRSQFLFSQKLIGAEQQPSSSEANDAPVKKIWQFKTSEGMTLNVQNDTLDISSEKHKSYNNPSSKNRFRDVIEFAINNFLVITKLPLLTRIGLRYINECPVPSAENGKFQSFYNTSLPLVRFDLSETIEMYAKSSVQKKGF